MVSIDKGSLAAAKVPNDIIASAALRKQQLGLAA